MSYGVRDMEKKLLFSNRYEKDMNLFDDLPDDMPELSDIDDAKVPTIDDFYEYMNKKRRCVPNKERIANKDQFIKTVSELSETYKINADLSEFDAGYIANIYLDYTILPCSEIHTNSSKAVHPHFRAVSMPLLQSPDCFHL